MEITKENRVEELLKPMHERWRKKKEKEMASKSIHGSCEICGDNKNLKQILGKKCCSTCEFIRRGVKNKPELVVAELLDQHGTKYIPDGKDNKNELKLREILDALVLSLAPGNDYEDLQGYLDNLIRDHETMESNYGKMAKKMKDMQADYEEDLSKLRGELAFAEKKIENLIALRNEAEQSRDSLLEHNKEIAGLVMELEERIEKHESANLNGLSIDKLISSPELLRAIRVIAAEVG